MERTWVDNAFWTTDEKAAVTAIAESTAKDGKVTRQVLTILKVGPDGSENPDFIELINSLTEEKIDANTTERAERRARDTAMQQQRQAEKIRAHALEMLFEAKLKAFEVEDVKNCTNRVLKSKLRKAKNLIEVNAYATIIIMEQMNAAESESDSAQ